MIAPRQFLAAALLAVPVLAGALRPAAALEQGSVWQDGRPEAGAGLQDAERSLAESGVLHLGAAAGPGATALGFPSLGDESRMAASLSMDVGSRLSLIGSAFRDGGDAAPGAEHGWSFGVVGNGMLQEGDRLGLFASSPQDGGEGMPARASLGDSAATAAHAPDLQLFYSMAVGGDSALGTSATLRSQDDPTSDAPDEGVFLLRARHSF